MRMAMMAAAIVCASASAWAQTPPDGATLTETVRALDAELFEAYNRCDLDKLGAMVADDLEFYHDVSGLSRGKASFVAAIKQNICGKVHRDLVPGTLEVYPLKTYGAVEIGEHVFCDARKSAVCDPDKSGVAKFTMLWQLSGGKWLLTRVISYDHVSDWQRPAKK